MENQDGARILLEHFAQVFPQHEDHRRAYYDTRDAFPALHDEVVARSRNMGHVPPIVVGEEFRYRFQLMLAGLHNDPIRGICNDLNGVATCIVLKYPLHNFDVGDGNYVAGGEGGEIAEAHLVGQRILEHQRAFSPGNIGMHNALMSQRPVRLVVYQAIQPGGNNVGNNPTDMGYAYRGLYTVANRFEFQTVLNYTGFEFQLVPLLALGDGDADGDADGMLLLEDA